MTTLRSSAKGARDSKPTGLEKEPCEDNPIDTSRGNFILVIEKTADLGLPRMCSTTEQFNHGGILCNGFSKNRDEWVETQSINGEESLL